MTETNIPQHTIIVPASIPMVALLGPGDEHLALIEKAFKADVHVRGNQITLRGESAEVALAERLMDELVTIIRTGQGITTETVERAISMLRAETKERPADVLSLNILSNRGRTIRPKTLNQKRYVEAIDKHTIVFGIGPAGTGKTYLAMAKAVQALQSKNVNRIILTRPAVEAGERLGFLPGTLSEKIDPYLRPLYDALPDMLDPDTIPELLAAGRALEEDVDLAHARRATTRSWRPRACSRPLHEPGSLVASARPWRSSAAATQPRSYATASSGRSSLTTATCPSGSRNGRPAVPAAIAARLSSSSRKHVTSARPPGARTRAISAS